MPKVFTKTMRTIPAFRRATPRPAAGLHDPDGAKTYFFHELVPIKYPEQFLIGRSPSCQVCLRDGMVSSRHAMLHRTEAGYCIRDHGSKNGTYVRGRRLTQLMLVTVGMRIWLGPAVLIGVDDKGRAPVDSWVSTLSDFCRCVVLMYGNAKKASERLDGNPSREYIRRRNQRRSR